jgi:hypothetical protein
MDVIHDKTFRSRRRSQIRQATADPVQTAWSDTVRQASDATLADVNL